MFYYLAQLRDYFFGFNIFRYITFRAGMAAVTTFLFCMIFGSAVIQKFKAWRIEECLKRDDCPQLDPLHCYKEGTPTMGGVFIVGSIIVSVLMWCDLANRFVQLTLLTCLWMALLGWTDDYIKLTRRRKGKRGLGARTKFFWQCLLGFCVGLILYLDPATTTKIDIPFFKNIVIDLGIFYIPFVILVIVSASNAVNVTDGLDGLAIGNVLMVALGLGALSYITGNVNFSKYLFIPYVSGAGELLIFSAAIVGASLGFLWFNCYPASIFMGDVGSLALGGMLGVIAVLIKKEFLLILLGGIFVIEVLSVLLQILSIKIRHKRFLKVSPLHHHLQLIGWSESKIIIRFWIIGIIFILLTLTTLKIR
ncbi:MAG: phospho-N-acetylmuramoyl-pentapeptide-transferase [Candidatus Omnitrophota bacterium]